MIIIFHKRFLKEYAKLRPSERKKFKERRDIFVADQFDPLLRNHELTGSYRGHRSIAITGDVRAHYYLISPDTALFTTIGTHSELYE